MLKNGFQYLGYDRIKQKHSGSCTKCERVLYRGTYDIFERPVCCATFFKSKDEKEIREYVESLGFKADTKRIDGREFDIFVKDKNFAIEYNGLYWHSEDFLNDKGYNGKLYHRDKFNRSLEEGFDLFTLFEHSWKEKPDQVKAFIRSKLGIFTQTIYARKTTVKNIDKNIANDFLDRNHLQGRTNIDKAYGLYYGEDLIGVMSFGRHHRDPNYKGIILNRLAFERDIRVVGGASKLLSFAKEGLKSEGTREILTWSDNNYSKGKVYASLGFTRSKDLPPTYFYFKNGKAYSSQSLKKTKEEKGLGSEKELRAKQGYRRIYNCGKVQWRMKIDG